ncbi:MAG: hypothetical protein HY741_17795 [Chloroflexi bacterium]|nr:hypothetical protein [Chloroflexota bacterium]
MKLFRVRFFLVLVLLGLLVAACDAPASKSLAVANVTATTAPSATETPLVPSATDIPPTVTATNTPLPPTATESPSPTPTTEPTKIPATNTATAAPTKRPPTGTRLPRTPTLRPPTRVPTASAAQMPDSFTDTFDQPGILRASQDDICTRSYEGGQFHIRVTRQNFLCWSFYPRVYTKLKMDVDVTMHSGEGSCGGDASVVFGYNDNKNYYLLQTNRTCRGYNVVKRTPDGWQTIRKWDQGLRVGPSPADGVTVTHLTLIVNGSELQLYSNGELMDKVNDSSYQGGRVGVSAGTWGQDSHVRFDNLQIQAQ